MLSTQMATAQITNAVRPITLQECFEMALRDNLDLQIQRIDPSLSLLDLEIARAGYDPRLTLSGTHSHIVSAGGRDENNQQFRGSTSDTDAFRSSVIGLGPYGFQYVLSGNLSDTYGDQPNFLNPLLRDQFENANGSVGISMSQPLLRNFLTDAVRYNIAVAKSQIKGSELELRNQIIGVVTAVEKAYNELIYSRENIKVQDEGLRLAQQLLSDNKKRVQVGILSPLDEKQSESEAYARQADRSSALRALATAQNNLKRLITANYQELHEFTLQPSELLVAVPRTFDTIESWTSALNKRPDVLEARRLVELQGVAVKFLKNQRLPQLDVTGSYGYGGSGAREFSSSIAAITSQEQPFWSVGAVASVPLLNKGATSSYRRARATADQLLLSLKRQEQTVMVQVDEAINALRTTLDRVESSRQARIYAEQALDGGQKRLQAGTSTSFEILQLQRDLINARTAEIRAVADYNNFLADLYQAEGTTLERKRINVEVR
jgi:outer membrane protein TolC